MEEKVNQQPDPKILEYNQKQQSEIGELLKDFVYPPHNSKCKVCNGTGKIGYYYIKNNADKTQEKFNEKKDDNGDRVRGPAIPCHVYEDEIKQAMQDTIHMKVRMAIEQDGQTIYELEYLTNELALITESVIEKPMPTELDFEIKQLEEELNAELQIRIEEYVFEPVPQAPGTLPQTG